MADAEPVPELSAAPADAAARVLRQFRLVFNAVKSHIRQVEKVAGIGGAQLWASNMGSAGARDRQPRLSHNFDVVVEKLLDHEPRCTDRRIDAYEKCIDLPVGRIGLTEAQALKAGHKLRTGTAHDTCRGAPWRNAKHGVS